MATIIKCVCYQGDNYYDEYYITIPERKVYEEGEIARLATEELIKYKSWQQDADGVDYIEYSIIIGTMTVDKTHLTNKIQMKSLEVKYDKII